MRVLHSILTLLLIPSLILAQKPGSEKKSTQHSQQEWEALSELIGLRQVALTQIKSPLARVTALLEIAEVTWAVDSDVAKVAVRAAYQLTTASDTDSVEQRQAREVPGQALREALIRNDLRRRILYVAKRDPNFANELTGSGSETSDEPQLLMEYGKLVAQAIESRDSSSATESILFLQDVAPATVSGISGLVNEIARTNRAAADGLILQIIERLQVSDFSSSKPGTLIGLEQMIMPTSMGRGSVPPPGPDAVRAYLNFVIAYFSRVKQSDPAALKTLRSVTLRAGSLSQLSAPDLLPTFLYLEQLSRDPKETPWSPDVESARQEFGEAGNDAAGNDGISEHKVSAHISRGEFDKARELINKIGDAKRRDSLLEVANAQEAITLATAGDVAGAEKPASELTRKSSISAVYARLIRQLISKGEREPAAALTQRALQRLTPKGGSPPSVGRTPSPEAAATDSPSATYDQSLAVMNSFMRDIAQVDESLGLTVMREVVSAANNSPLDTSLGLSGLDYEIFRRLSVNNEDEVLQASLILNDPLRRTLALAKVTQAKLERLQRNKGSKKPVSPAKATSSAN